MSQGHSEPSNKVSSIIIRYFYFFVNKKPHLVSGVLYNLIQELKMVKFRVLRFKKMTFDNMNFEFGTITLLVSFIIHLDLQEVKTNNSNLSSNYTISVFELKISSLSWISSILFSNSFILLFLSTIFISTDKIISDEEYLSLFDFPDVQSIFLSP